MLLKFTKKGIYCEKGDFYIDPVKGVDHALITHAHSDHARWGSKSYLAQTQTAAIMRLRLGIDINVQEVEYRQTLNIKGIKVTFYPSGHIIGASQIKVTDGKETWVVSGDYKVVDDKISTPFEPIKCNHFVTESTFALPVFNWLPQEEIFNNINTWWRNNASNNLTSVIYAYTLGKSQRILQNIDDSIGKIVMHGSTAKTNQVVESLGFKLPKTYSVLDTDKNDLKKALVITPASVKDSPWMKRFSQYSSAQASGWMQIGGIKRRDSLDQGFVLSDHADWQGLLSAIKQTGAENIYVTHGYTNIFARYLNELGLNATPVKVDYWGEDTEEPENDIS